LSQQAARRSARRPRTWRTCETKILSPSRQPVSAPLPRADEIDQPAIVEVGDIALGGEQTLVSRQSIRDAAQLLRLAPAKGKGPKTLPTLQGELNFVYAHTDAPERALESRAVF
jgi:hypothetical protein